MSNYDNNRSNRRRSNKKQRDFVPTDKHAAVLAELQGYGVYTQDRRGDYYDWAMSRKQCNIKLQEVKRKFGLSGLNATRDALLTVEDLYNGELDNTALTPIQLRNEVQRVQLVRTLLLTSRCADEEEFNSLRDELDQADLRDLRVKRGEVRDRIWGADRDALRARIDKAIKKGKKKGKVKSVKKGKGNRNRNRQKAHA